MAAARYWSSFPRGRAHLRGEGRGAGRSRDRLCRPVPFGRGLCGGGGPVRRSRGADRGVVSALSRGQGLGSAGRTRPRGPARCSDPRLWDWDLGRAARRLSRLRGAGHTPVSGRGVRARQGDFCAEAVWKLGGAGAAAAGPYRCVPSYCSKLQRAAARAEASSVARTFWRVRVANAGSNRVRPCHCRCLCSCYFDGAPYLRPFQRSLKLQF